MQSNDTVLTCEQCGTLFPNRRPWQIIRFCGQPCSKAYRRALADATRETRFWSYVDRTDSCWLWTRSGLPRGYGQFVIGHGKAMLAHRAAWTFATGDTLTRADAIGHICDNPPCVRNDDEGVYEVGGILLPRRGHLFKGTVIDNNRDMTGKGRRRTGSKLSRDEAEAIRVRWALGDMRQHEIADMYGVSQSLISLIVLNRIQH